MHTEQHLHRGRSHGPGEPGSAEHKVGRCHPVSLQVCAGCSGCFSALFRGGKEGSRAAEMACAVMAALRPGQPPGRAPVSRLEGHFLGRCFTAHVVALCTPVSILRPHSLGFSHSSPEPFLWSCPHSCPMLTCPPPPQVSCCLPPPLPAASSTRLPCRSHTLTAA